MKNAIFCLAFIAPVVYATDTVITPQGTYQVSQAGSTTYVVGPNATPPIAVPVTVNPITGIGTVITNQGVYQVQRSQSGGTTTVIGKGAAPAGRGK